MFYYLQITQISEKPGALLVEWQHLETDEHNTDIQEYRLQRAFGNTLKEKHLIVNFVDSFVGSDTQFLVKDLQSEQVYSFRVCCKFEGCNEWSPWSLTQVGATSLKPYSWAKNENFTLTNENKIAVSHQSGLLLSEGPQFRVGCSIEFMVSLYC